MDFINIETVTFKHYETRSGEGSYSQIIATCNVVYLRRQDEFFKIKIARGRFVHSFIVKEKEYERIVFILTKGNQS